MPLGSSSSQNLLFSSIFLMILAEKILTMVQKNVDPHFRGLDLGAEVEFFHRIFFIPLVQSEFYQEITKPWLGHQNPCTGVVRRSYSPPQVGGFITPFI